MIYSISKEFWDKVFGYLNDIEDSIEFWSNPLAWARHCLRQLVDLKNHKGTKDIASRKYTIRIFSQSIFLHKGIYSGCFCYFIHFFS